MGNKFYIILQGRVDVKIPDLSRKRRPSAFRNVDGKDDREIEEVKHNIEAQISKPEMIAMLLLKNTTSSLKLQANL
jgi:predicted ester cyclase